MGKHLTKSNRPEVVGLDSLAAMVAGGDLFGVGGHHFARLPIALLRAICRRQVGGLRYVSWAGGLSLELLLEADAVASIDLCFSSLDIFGLPPRFRAAAEAGRLPVRDWTALAMIQALRASQQNLPSLPFQLPVGSAMMDRIPGAVVAVDPVSAAPVGVIPALHLDTVVLHAQRADMAGNVQIVGALALDLAMIGAARTVLVTVEEIVPSGSLAEHGRQTVLLRNQVSAIAVVPGGAWPTSCLPFYTTDFSHLAAAFESDRPLQTSLALPPSGAPSFVRGAASVGGNLKPLPNPAVHASKPPPSLDEIMSTRIAAMLDNESFASAGAVSPLANVAYRLAKATHAPGMIIATLSCGHLDIAPLPLIPSLFEGFDAATAVRHAGGDESYSVFYQAGAVTHEIIAAAQVDCQGRVNNLAINRKRGGIIRLPGQGGMADVANMHRDYALYVTRHSPLTLVDVVDFASSGRGLLRAEERAAAGYRTGDSLVFTDLCVFRLDPDLRQLVVIETMPGVSRLQISEATAFPVVFASDCRETALPDREVLEILRHRIDPLGLRRLEFVAGRDRGALIAEILAADRAMVTSMIGDVT